MPPLQNHNSFPSYTNQADSSNLSIKPGSPTNIAVLFSGGGRTLENLFNLSQLGKLDINIAIAISSNRHAGGIERCKRLDILCQIVRPGDFNGFDDKYAFSKRVFELIRAAGVELVCMAGYLSLLPIPDDYLGRVINIHPALLPAFGGKGMYGDRVHRAVLDIKNITESGCTVHFADNQYDHGSIILQRRCPVKPDDTVETLGARVFAEECLAYPQAIRMIQNGETRFILPDDQA